MPRRAFRMGITGTALILLLSHAALARDPWPRPTISIIIDDIGYRHMDDQRALDLPGPVAYAVMPRAPFAEMMSALAAKNGKEVLVHMPMEPDAMRHNEFLGPGALTTHMGRDEFLRTVEFNLRSVPGAVGVNNHMGSLLTQSPMQMEWLMDFLKARNHFYVDSMTSHLSIAGTMAELKELPILRRDVFLDNAQDAPDIQNQFDELIRVARRRGRAIAIGHPHPETIAVLQRRLRELDAYGVTLVSLRHMLQQSTPRFIPVAQSLSGR
ncbi:MAG: divergent polysaccharide deacetylase family protein [Gammaproteobacteria bacterium]|nr:divergent polysaccharide deacetylase family protein [Gammaproteobacteria bacterium]